MKEQKDSQTTQLVGLFLIYKFMTRNKKVVVQAPSETSYNLGFIAAKLFRKLLK